MPPDSTPPVSVIIPTLDAANGLPVLLAALEEGRAAGVLREVIVVDGGSRDATVPLAQATGAHVAASPRGRGVQLATGAALAGGEWLLFLHADTVPARGWSSALADFIAVPANRGRAGYFRLRFDDRPPAARILEAAVRWRCRLLALPYGDQGLLLSAELLRALGGFRPLPLMEDVDLVRRLGRGRLSLLDAEVVTSAARYRRDGYVARPLRNLFCLGLYFVGVPPRLLLRLYG
ncbi:MAG TPA: TIGR04283 family arsenosugar biosynthesis glycosyltransferase [Stellaceae bacterium]|nr:TIGR04283 family arsenosugar biosynthesis glycosyltransferase [Stellaceae bacterium]